MTLLQIMQGVFNELGFPAPTAVVTSTDPQTVQLLALLNRMGKDLTRRYYWEQLSKDYVFTTVNSTTTGDTTDGSTTITVPSTTGITTDYSVSGNGLAAWTQVTSIVDGTTLTVDLPATATGTGVTLTFTRTNYPLPSDWLKETPNTEWDRTNRWPLLGPKSAQEWAYLKGGIVSAGPRMRYRIRGEKYQLNPTPAADINISLEYVSKNWVESATSTTGFDKDSFTVDTDTCAFDDSLMIIGLKLQWLMNKGLTYDFALVEYQKLLDQILSQNKSAPILNLAPINSTILLGVGNLPETGYGR